MQIGGIRQQMNTPTVTSTTRVVFITSESGTGPYASLWRFIFRSSRTTRQSVVMITGMLTDGSSEYIPNCPHLSRSATNGFLRAKDPHTCRAVNGAFTVR